MLLGQNWNSGRAGEGVKTEDWEALKQNTIVIVLIFISIATPMQYFSLTPGIPLLWSPAGLSLETSNGTGTGKVPVWLWIVGKWMRFEEIGSNLLVQRYGLPWGVGQIRPGGLSSRNRKGPVEMAMAAGAVDSNNSVGGFSRRFCGDGRSMSLLKVTPQRDTLAFECNVLEIWV